MKEQQSITVRPKIQSQPVYFLSGLDARVNLKLERNSRGYNWEITILNAKDVDEAISLLLDAQAKMVSLYGAPTEGEK